MPLNEYIKHSGTQVIDMIGSSTMTTINGVTTIHNGTVKITVNGKSAILSGKLIQSKNNEWFVDGKKVDLSNLPAEVNLAIAHIEINGNVENLQTTSGDVTVHGDINRVNTVSGDVTCEKVGNSVIKSMSISLV